MSGKTKSDEVAQAIKILRHALNAIDEYEWARRGRVGSAVEEAFETLVAAAQGTQNESLGPKVGE